MSHSTVRLGNEELGAVTELHRVNLSSENRFEASPLRGNSRPRRRADRIVAQFAALHMSANVH
jgi:hypothetical protein